MEYIKIRNWEKWQTYRKDRGQPPWIKIHRCVMRNPEWVSLSDAEKGQLVCLWLLGADHDGSIPSDPALIKQLCYLNKSPNLKKFQDLQFLENDGCQGDVNMTPQRRQHDAPKAEENREEKNKYSECVLLTEKQYENLISMFGEHKAKEKIQELNDGIQAYGYKYKSHYHTILSWYRKQKRENPQQSSPNYQKLDMPDSKDDISSDEYKKKRDLKSLTDKIGSLK